MREDDVGEVSIIWVPGIRRDIAYTPLGNKPLQRVEKVVAGEVTAFVVF